MTPRPITPKVSSVGAVDWDRRLFDSLIPLPDGTSYNAYLVRGRDKTALLDTVDPAKRETLFDNLGDVARLDYLVAHHGEQDHSGTIPKFLKNTRKPKWSARPRPRGSSWTFSGFPTGGS